MDNWIKQRDMKKRITYNSPVILTFAAVSLVALILNALTGGISNKLLFAVYRSSPLNPLTYIRIFGHVLGHADFGHYFGNMMYFLLLGPAIEEKYGSSDTLLMIAATAIITGLVNMILFPNTALLGASGVVFCFIVISSMTGFKNGNIPLTLILVVILYLGQEVYSAIFVADNVSQLTHILGGIVGCAFGFLSKKVENK